MRGHCLGPGLGRISGAGVQARLLGTLSSAAQGIFLRLSTRPGQELGVVQQAVGVVVLELQLLKSPAIYSQDCSNVNHISRSSGSCGLPVRSHRQGPHQVKGEAERWAPARITGCFFRAREPARKLSPSGSCAPKESGLCSRLPARHAPHSHPSPLAFQER